MQRPMKIGPVLGAGGVLGGAWLTGGLDALARETGWDSASADRIVGTLCASGVPPWFMVAYSSGESFEGPVDGEGRPASEADRDGGATFRLHRALPFLGPGSWRLGPQVAREPEPAYALAGGEWVASAGFDLDGAARAHDPPRRAPRLVVAPSFVDRRLRLHDRPAGALRPRGFATRRARPGGRRLMRHPRVLPPGLDRRAPLRRRRSERPAQTAFRASCLP